MSEPKKLSLLPSPSVLMAQRHPDISECHAKFLKRQESFVDAAFREVLEGAWLQAATVTAMFAFFIALVGLFDLGVVFTLTATPLFLAIVAVSLWRWGRRYYRPGRHWVASLDRGEREELVRAANEVLGETIEAVEGIESVDDTQCTMMASSLRRDGWAYFADVLSEDPETREKGVIALFASRNHTMNSLDYDVSLAEKQLRKAQQKQVQHQQEMARKKDVEAALTARPQRAATHPQT